MRERPILFSAPMVRAILEGRKTQTRRLVKPEPVFGGPLRNGWHWSRGAWNFPIDERAISMRALAEVCPYGQPGDRLWVRETWRPVPTNGGDLYVQFASDADLRNVSASSAARDWERSAGLTTADERWRPSIHMPRWASRITLEVTGVRVERLQDITEEDARAEGVEQIEVDGGGVWRDYELGDGTWCNSARGSFGTLWRSLNGPESWDASPWVWVVEFKRVEVSP